MDAESAFEKVKEALAAATINLSKVMKAAEKIELHCEDWLIEMKQEQERLAELELEDFHVKSMTNGDGYDEFFD